MIARSARSGRTWSAAKARSRRPSSTSPSKSSRRTLVVNEAEQRIAATQTAVASAQENFRLAQGRFDAGVGTILELTDAQLSLTQAQNNEARRWPTSVSRSPGWRGPSGGGNRRK